MNQRQKDRKERIEILLKRLMKKGLNKKSESYDNLVYFCSYKFGSSERTSKEYVDTALNLLNLIKGKYGLIEKRN